MTFLHPHLLYLLLLIPLLGLWYYFFSNRNNATWLIPSISFLSSVKGRGLRVWLRHLPFALRLLSLALLIVAIARPQSINSWSQTEVEGIDIVMAMDISGSMLAMDFEPNRLEAAKEVAFRFVKNRPNDQIGLILFSGESFTACPLTRNHATLLNRLVEVQSGMIEDGTAIGVGLATAINRVKDSKTKSKVIILLTDGVNNKGDISPNMAAELASTYGISVYTIAVGTDAPEAPYPIPTAMGTVIRNIPVDVDETTLKQIAQKTGGEYFRATDNDALHKIYQQIDKLEKSKLSTRNRQEKHEEFFIFALMSALALVLELILRNTYLRTNP